MPPDEVEAVAEALSALPDDIIQDGLQSKKIKVASLYHDPWEKEYTDDLINLVNKLKRFYKNAAKKGNAILRHTG